MRTARVPNFFHDKPLFGLDIGHGSLKVMQLSESLTASKHPHLTGYGTASFDETAQDNGVIVKPEVIAKAAREMFDHHLIGDITSRLVALAIHTYRTFTSALLLPKL
jgi:Tfp pilus assembly PilM family ATPase